MPDDTESLSDSRRSGTVSRALRVLTIISEAGQPVGVQSIAKKCGLPMSTVHRITNLLAADDFVAYDSRTRLYAVGPQMHRLTAILWNRNPAAVAQPVLDELSGRFNEVSVFFTLLPDELSIRIAAKSEGDRALRYVVALDAPGQLARGASGKSILAHLDAVSVERVYLAAVESDQLPLLPDWDEFSSQLRQIRDVGYAATCGERIVGACAVGAVVFGAFNEVVGGITLTYPQTGELTFAVDEVGEAVSRAAQKLSLRLGARSSQ